MDKWARKIFRADKDQLFWLHMSNYNESFRLQHRFSIIHDHCLDLVKEDLGRGLRNDLMQVSIGCYNEGAALEDLLHEQA